MLNKGYIKWLEKNKEKRDEQAIDALMNALAFEAIGSTAGRNVWLDKGAKYEDEAEWYQKMIDHERRQ